MPSNEPVPPNRQERRPPEVRRRYAKLIEAAEYLGVTDRTIRQMIADGRITGYRNGPRLIRVDLNEIDDVVMQPFGGGA
ncbi:DNA binding domain, excisionase family [Mycobacterium parascrofulaceum ATCC BAA-614]|uniref:DNA binding domain, excisionase family n=1 Tax=Mycobacterium parascrofulaceum ATCC BAA-614 TaxID=525368 RepID=D5PIE5_9MYCO|nr:MULTISPECIES: excisionase family DNA-binding protein [Mycobacterium]EFG74158.1 DNA binding domain, excisionase family [Mycobacterium parascrofulaceum ATCC BAA-614]OCB27697.1 DNA-binding protein [Mycobacterium malmoense]